jgi:hypothetical protein
MVNLLPQYWQKKLKEEEIFKTVSILGIVVVFGMLSFVLMLFLVKFFFSSSVASLQTAIDEKEREMAIFNVESEEKNIVSTNKSVSIIGDFYDRQTKITELFSRISQAKPAAVDLTNFSYSSGNIVIEGQSADRDSLVSFKNNLEACPEFKKITFPQDSWLKARDINFNASIDLAGKQ